MDTKSKREVWRVVASEAFAYWVFVLWPSRCNGTGLRSTQTYTTKGSALRAGRRTAAALGLALEEKQ